MKKHTKPNLFSPKWSILSCMMTYLILSSTMQLTAQDALTTALQHLEKTATEHRLLPADYTAPLVTDQYKSQHNGVTHLYVCQSHEGIPVFNAKQNFNIKNGKILSNGGAFIPHIAEQISSNSVGLTALEAVQMAATHLDLERPNQLNTKEILGGTTQKVVFAGGDYSHEKIPVELTYFYVNRGDVRITWNLSIYDNDTHNWWSVRVDAQTGELLDQQNWTTHCAIAPNTFFNPSNDCEEEAHTHEANAVTPLPMPKPLSANDYNVFAMPVESPSHGDRTIVNAPWEDAPNASPFGWHDTNGVDGQEYNITRGNNVWAYEDRNDSNGSSNNEPDGGDDLDFNFPIDFSLSPLDNEDAAVTNLFYWNNAMHDVWYEYGFDEPSGNFQQNNYGSSGDDGDEVRAEAQDGSGINNANFATPEDGDNPRMQMYEWGSSATLSFQIEKPNEIAGIYFALPAGFGGSFPSSDEPLIGNIVSAFDATADPTLVCEDVENIDDIAGNIALIDRSECNFTVKVKNAQDAGAVAVIICNNIPDDGVFNMGGIDGTITIPSLMLSYEDCQTIRVFTDELATTDASANISIQGGSQNIDGDFDNGVICHEYGHGISTRLTGGPNTSCLSGEEQMGEGWSDWFGLVMTVEENDMGEDGRGIGVYASNQPITGTGIRTYRYSTDMDINPHTYVDVANESVPHGVGSVWCAMIWDLYWALVAIHGFDEGIYAGTGGNNIAMQLVMDGMKLQPCSPGFTDARDAIILADEINYDSENTNLIWEVFARRGLGFSADQGSSSAVGDETQAFDLPPLQIIKDAPETAIAGEPYFYTFTVENRTNEAKSGIALTDLLPGGFSIVPGSIGCGGVDIGGFLVFPEYDLLLPGESFECSMTVIPDVGNVSTIFLEDDIESGTDNWALSNGTGSDDWILLNNNTFSGDFVWHALNPASATDQYLAFETPILIEGENPALSFYHYFDTETGWDGGVVELAVGTGSNWQDLGDYMTQNGYSGFLQVNPASALSGREAFHGNSGDYIQTIVDLSSFTGQEVRIRFRFASDGFLGADGWYIDDVRVFDAVIITNEACVSSDQGDDECDQVNTIILAPTEVGISETLLPGLSLSPNPAQSVLYLNSQTQNNLAHDLQLFSVTGQKVWEANAVFLEKRYAIPVEQLNSGVYLLTVRNAAGIWEQKVIVE